MVVSTQSLNESRFRDAMRRNDRAEVTKILSNSLSEVWPHVQHLIITSEFFQDLDYRAAMVRYCALDLDMAIRVARFAREQHGESETRAHNLLQLALAGFLLAPDTHPQKHGLAMLMSSMVSSIPWPDSFIWNGGLFGIEPNPLKEAESVHQALMDQAYQRWENGDLRLLSYDEFVDRLPELQRIAVTLGNLNYQVENGGFQQWVENGYSTQLGNILGYLQHMRHLEHGEQMIDLMQKAREAVREYEIFNSGYSWQWDGREDERDETEDEIYAAFESLDDVYYEFCEAWMVELNQWFRAQF